MNITKFLRGILLIIILVGIDLYTKYLAMLYLTNGTKIEIIKNVIGLTYVENRGAAFGMLSGRLAPVIIITPIIVIALLILLARLSKIKRFNIFSIVICFFIAGALGNFIDRVYRGYVVDFFELQFVNFPVFNVADIYLTVSSVVVVIFLMFIFKEQDLEVLNDGIKNKHIS